MLHWAFSLFSFDAALWKTAYEIIHRAKSSLSHPTNDPSILLAAIWPYCFRNAEAHALLWKRGLLTTSRSLNGGLTRLAAWGTDTRYRPCRLGLALERNVIDEPEPKILWSDWTLNGKSQQWMCQLLTLSCGAPVNSETYTCQLWNCKGLQRSDSRQLGGFLDKKWWITVSTSLLQPDRWKTSITEAVRRTKAWVISTSHYHQKYKKRRVPSYSSSVTLTALHQRNTLLK